MEKENENGSESLYFLINKARGLTIDAVGQIMELTKIPPYLMDCILSGVLADIRQKEIYDMGLLTAQGQNTKDEKTEESLVNAEEDSDGKH